MRRSKRLVVKVSLRGPGTMRSVRWQRLLSDVTCWSLREGLAPGEGALGARSSGREGGTGTGLWQARAWSFPERRQAVWQKPGRWL